MSDLLSRCHSAPLKVYDGPYDGKTYWICGQCNKPTEAAVSKKLCHSCDKPLGQSYTQIAGYNYCSHCCP